MANVTKLTDKLLQVKGLDADWSIPGDMPGFAESGINVRAIKFWPSGDNDILIIKAGLPSQATTLAAIATTLTAPELVHVKALLVTLQRVEFGGESGLRMWPFIDISDCTFGTAANARVEFELA